MCRWMRFPPGSWEGSCLDTEFVPWWAGLALDYCWEGLELSPRAVPDSTVKTEVCDLALEACTDGHVSCQVPWWTGMLSNYGREAVVVSGLPECLPAGPCACSTAVDWAWEGLEPRMGSFRVSLCSVRTVTCWVPVPAGLWTAAGLDWSSVMRSFQNLHFDGSWPRVRSSS